MNVILSTTLQDPCLFHASDSWYDWQVLPYLLKNLIKPELDTIESARINGDSTLDSIFSGGVVDPCIKLAGVMYKFVVWAFEERCYNQSAHDILIVARLGQLVQEQLKEIFPTKSGNTKLL